MSPSSEVRAHPRVEIGERCWIETGSLTLYAKLENISLGGVFIRTSTPVPQGTPVQLRCSLDDGNIRLEAGAVVAWVRLGDPERETASGMGVTFAALEAAVLAQLEAFVTERLPA